MSQHVEGDFQVTSWDENQASGLEGTAKVAIARIGQRFTGGIEADTVTDTVMVYADDGTAEFVGYQRVAGTVADRTGSFVLRGTGTFDGNEARTNLQVVPGSGRGGLAGLGGSGLAVAPIGSTGTYSFDYEL